MKLWRWEFDYICKSAEFDWTGRGYGHKDLRSVFKFGMDMPIISFLRFEESKLDSDAFSSLQPIMIKLGFRLL